MSNDKNNMEDRLWAYIDGTASNQERTVIDELIEKDAAWKASYKELLSVNELLQSSELEAPSMRFTKNVMEEIHKLHIGPSASTYINKKIIWSIGGFFIATIIGFLIYGFAQIQWNVADDNTVLKNVNKLDFSRMFNNTWVNVLMMINVIVGLFLLDNYLSKKRKAFRKEA